MEEFLRPGCYFGYEVSRRPLGNPTGLPDPDFNGWYLQASWVLTGEAKPYRPATGSFGSPKPAQNFTVDKGGWGAWEVAARYSDLNLNYDEGVFGKTTPFGGIRGGDQRIWSAGLNWYPNQVIRLMLDYQHVDVSRLTVRRLARRHARRRLATPAACALIGDQRRNIMKKIIATALACALASATAAQAANVTLLNVSYDPTRELYKDINNAFAAQWKQKTGDTVTINMSHNGSGRAVPRHHRRSRCRCGDARAPPMILTRSHRRQSCSRPTGRSACRRARRHTRRPIVFLVRKGNPWKIKDWPDLVKPGVHVVTPNPKTSGGARWSYLAAWAYAEKAAGGSKEKAKAFVAELYSKHVPVLDTGARGATTTFAQRGIGDVLLSWENEAHLALQEAGGDKYQIVYPSNSILAEPPVAVIDKNVDRHKTRAVAEAYLQFLYTPQAQEIEAKDFYRPRDQSILNAHRAQFPNIPLYTIDEVFGGWTKAQQLILPTAVYSTRFTSPGSNTVVALALPRVRNRSALPGFGLSMGFTLFYLSAIVLIPLAALVIRPWELGFADFWKEITAPRVLAALKLSFGASAIAAAVQQRLRSHRCMVLVRYRFPGKKVVDALVDLPFALPTAVAGIALSALYAGNGWIGGPMERAGLKIAYTPRGVVVALIFIGLRSSCARCSPCSPISAATRKRRPRRSAPRGSRLSAA